MASQSSLLPASFHDHTESADILCIKYGMHSIRLYDALLQTSYAAHSVFGFRQSSKFRRPSLEERTAVGSSFLESVGNTTTTTVYRIVQSTYNLQATSIKGP